MTDFLKITIKNLVEHPAEVLINESVEENSVFYEVYLKPEDVGRVIGRHGQIIDSIRQILKAVGKKKGINYFIEIKEHLVKN
ncbi:RNA-binding protein (KH domain) [Thermodesulfobium narugense DSM 14796]|uniref:RNA-binding protein KhpA n=1 Tax=Thermodesulfobium narugense DSM 14796 TaxID=747365 RepID=M1E7T9_9BACT|nr:KH domain-containing protein [Thermodesulfobium narugense]AEE14615.1 RNA-binding protein (KH domain) [Thermodesulfobium narugense DSM 14796]